MSASREKKNRRNTVEVTPVETTKKGMSKGLKRALTIAVSVVLIAAIVFLSMVSLSFFEKHTTAVVADGHKLSPAMMNFFYIDGVNEMGSYIGLDTETPLSEQAYSGDKFETWADYFLDYAADQAADTYAIYEDAMANGYTLSEEAQLSLDNEISMTELYAQVYGVSADQMVASNFGTGTTMELYKEYLTITAVVDEYTAQKYTDISFSGIEINEYYAEHAEDFDGVTFRYFLVTPSVLGQAEGEEDMAACEEAANAIAEAAKDGEEAYLEAVKGYMTEDAAASAESSTLYQDYAISSCPEEFREWLSDDARAEGDTFVTTEDDLGYAALYFVRSEDHMFQMPNVRHILISADSSADEETKAEAAAKAQEILDQYLAGEQTEDAFAELAKTNSADNAEAGGLYEDIAPGTMVDAFDAWCYDEARQVGDTGIVETEYGYHIMYFSGYGETYQNYLVENVMITKSYSEWRTNVTADVTYTITDNAKRYMSVL